MSTSKVNASLINDLDGNDGAVLQVMVNEEVDPSLVISRLKQEIVHLKEQIRLLTGDANDAGPLSADELASLRKAIAAYVDETAPDARLAVGARLNVIHAGSRPSLHPCRVICGRASCCAFRLFWQPSG